jgi:hypothetical protein
LVHCSRDSGNAGGGKGSIEELKARMKAIKDGTDVRAAAKAAVDAEKEARVRDILCKQPIFLVVKLPVCTEPIMPPLAGRELEPMGV